MQLLASRPLTRSTSTLVALATLAACGSPAAPPPGASATGAPSATQPTPPTAPASVAVHRADLPGACTPDGLCWEHPRPVGAMWSDVATAGDAAVAVGAGGALARLTTAPGGEPSITLATPLGRDLRLVRAAGETVVVAGSDGFVARVDRALVPARLARPFPERPTSPVLDLWAAGDGRVLAGGLYGGVAEASSSGGWVDRSAPSRDASAFGAGADGALAVAAGTTFRWLSDPSAAVERIPISEPVTRIVVVDRTHVLALGRQGALAERDADGWHELMPRTPRTITPGQAFRSLVVLDHATTPTLVVIDHHGAAYSRQGWHRDGGAFREEPIAWPAPLAGPQRGPTTWWLEALDDGRVIAGGEAFAVRQRDGTWRASAQREPADYVACAVRGHEAWAVGWRGGLAHFDGEAWTTLTEAAGRGHHVVGLAAAGDAVLAITEFGLLARDSSGGWRELALPEDIAGHARLRVIAAQDERFVVAGEVRSEGLCLEVVGEGVSRLPCDGPPITALAPVGDALVAARGAELVRLGPEGALPLGARLEGPADAETPLELGPLLALSQDELLVAASAMGVFRVTGDRAVVDHRYEREPSTAGGTEPVGRRISSLAMHDGVVVGGTTDGRVLRRAAPGRWVEVPFEREREREAITWLGTIGGELWALAGRAYRLRGARLEVVPGVVPATVAVGLGSEGSVLLGGKNGAIVRMPAPR